MQCVWFAVCTGLARPVFGKQPAVPRSPLFWARLVLASVRPAGLWPCVAKVAGHARPSAAPLGSPGRPTAYVMEHNSSQGKPALCRSGKSTCFWLLLNASAHTPRARRRHRRRRRGLVHDGTPFQSGLWPLYQENDLKTTPFTLHFTLMMHIRD